MAARKKVSIGHNSINLIFSFVSFSIFLLVLLVAHCVCLMIVYRKKKTKIAYFSKLCSAVSSQDIKSFDILIKQVQPKFLQDFAPNGKPFLRERF